MFSLFICASLAYFFLCILHVIVYVLFSDFVLLVCLFVSFASTIAFISSSFSFGEAAREFQEFQFVHKPGLGIPTSSTPNQQPALAMPQFGERATLGPEA